ncbi:MAG TPA: hypothetical protein VFP85_09790 [Vicinamibacterales bacterium]|nr:hypothetical protein [Vicinamibacterales bacterium]
MHTKLLALVLSSAVSVAVLAQQEDRGTVVLRDGTRVEGRIDSWGNGSLSVRVSMADQRRIPVGNVALIDRVGGAQGLPETELREAAGPQHLLLLTDGSSMKGELIAIRGGAGSAEENEPRMYYFRTGDGQERRYSPQQVARVYLGNYPVRSATTPTETPAPRAGDVMPGAIRVPANVGWVNTGLRVRRGEQIQFNTSGEVQLSDNSGDRAQAAGSTRTASNSLLPSVGVGALIGRVGNSGPFGIGNQTSVPMPAEGLLFLSVNDDEKRDNSGEFLVSLSRAGRRY